MKVRLWHAICAAFLFGASPLGLVSCSSSQQQQGEDQVVENEEGEAQEGQEGYENNANQNDYGDGENAEGEQGYADQGQQDSQQEQQNELQEIIDGMNQQQSPGEGNGYANGVESGGQGYGEDSLGNQAYGDGEQGYADGSGLQQDPGLAEAQQVADGDQLVGTATQQQQAAVGLAAAPGLPELGSKMSYVVSRGDTLATIATKIYGDMEKWREIAEFTGMANPNMIYPGDVVYYQLTDQTMAFASAYEQVSRSEVVVQPGDTLSTISANVMGSSQDWKMIWRQNDNIDNPDVLTVGQTIYYVSPGVLTTAVSHAKSQIAKIQLQQATELARVEEVESISVSTTGSELVNSALNEFEADFASMESAGLTTVI